MTVKTVADFRKKFDPTHEGPPAEATFFRPIPEGQRNFIVVGAQNATPIVPEWWAILNTIAEDRNAFLMIIPLRYKNPTSIWTASQKNAEHWAPEVRPYLWNQRTELNPNLMVVGDVKIPPTKSSPLSSFDAMSTGHSAIFGHPKLQLKTIPTEGKMAKILTTTGVCTKENYTDSGLGKISEFHHSLSAVLVELNGDQFYMRQLHYSGHSQSCTDLDTTYTATQVGLAAPALAVSQGDQHIGFTDPLVEMSRYGAGGLLDRVRPKHLMWHDTLDAYSCNPHDRDNPFIQYANEDAGRSGARREVEAAIAYVKKYTRKGCESVIVQSNHDDMLSRWIKKEDWKKLGSANADFYLETALAMKRGTIATDRGVEELDPFVYWLRKAKLKGVRALDRGEKFFLAGVAMHMHGDEGPNGSRGSTQNLRRISVKVIKGHDHKAGIDEGCYSGGTTSYLDRTWLRGPSGWLNADVLLNADGKRQIIVYVNGIHTTKE